MCFIIPHLPGEGCSIFITVVLLLLPPPPSPFFSSSYLSLSGLGIVGLEVEEKLGELAGRAGMVGVGGLAGW